MGKDLYVIHICGHVYFREAKFCGVLSCVFDKLGCAAGEKWLRNTGIGATGGLL
jgi:hypothetical protein